MKYRAPYATDWQELDLETAMDMIANSLWESRERTFVEEEDGHFDVSESIALETRRTRANEPVHHWEESFSSRRRMDQYGWLTAHALWMD